MLKSAVLSPDTIVYLRGRIKLLLLCHAIYAHVYNYTFFLYVIDLVCSVRISVVDPSPFGTESRTESGSADPCHWITNSDPDSEPAFFVSGWPDANTKNYFFIQIFFLLPSEGKCTSVFIDKKSKRSHKIVEIKVFLTFFACWWKNSDPYKIMSAPDPGGQKHTDPQHV